MTTPRFISALASSAATLLIVSACTINIGVPRDNSMMGSPGSVSSSSEQRELMFAAMMIPHHEQAVEMSQLALENSEHDGVRDLARRIMDGQSVEIDIMQGWLDNADVADTRNGRLDHGMHGGSSMMGGMASEADLRRLQTLSSPEFDREFLLLMIEHHEGALDMVVMISGSTSPEAQKLHDDIVDVQLAEIQEMQDMLGELSDA